MTIISICALLAILNLGNSASKHLLLGFSPKLVIDDDNSYKMISDNNRE